MTRSAFLFKLLGVVGIGQAAHKHDRIGDRSPTIMFSGPGSSGMQCLGDGGHGTLEFVPCSCETDKENCPQGHCQKPKRINGTTSSLTIYAADEGAALGQVELHVCSICGIVYVPVTSAVPGDH